MELLFRTMAQNLSVSVGTVYNVCKLFEQIGCVDPRKQDCTTMRGMTNYDELLVIGIILENPSLYLGEICSKVDSIIGIDITPSTICCLLHRHCFTRKKYNKLPSKDQVSIYRRDFMAKVCFFKINQLVWLNETGCDR